MQQNLVLVTCSPLAKIFQRRFRVREKAKSGDVVESVITVQDLLKNKERIYKDEVFSVPFKSVTGDIIFWSGIPSIIQDQDKINTISGAFGGVRAQETDALGIVKLPVDENILSGMFALFGGGGSPDIQKAVKEALAKAKFLSHERCLNAARRVYERMVTQRQQIDEAGGKQKFVPSPTEMLCTYVLEKEASQEVAQREQTAKDFESMIERIEAGRA